MKSVATDVDVPRVRGHMIGESKFRPIVRNYRTSPEPIKSCIRSLLKAGHVRRGDPRSKVVSALALPFWLFFRSFNSGNISRPKFRIRDSKLQRSKTVKFFKFSFTVS